MRPAPLAALVLCLLPSACKGPERRLPPAYRAIALPQERLASSEARERGRALYLEHCALCHGIKADGQGVRREGLSSRPRDFTSPHWRREATPRTLYFAIREGVAGTAMPSWKSLDETDAWDLVAFLLSVGEPETAAKQGRAGGPWPENFAHEEPGTS
jgi:mono/diheme cytochrome c family protein